MGKDKQTEILEALKSGPVGYRDLCHGKKAPFQVAYRRLLAAGQIEESGMGTSVDPKYVGLPGAIFPARKMGVNPADVALLVRSGVPKNQAVAELREAGQQGEEAVAALCQKAHDKLFGMPVSTESPRTSR